MELDYLKAPNKALKKEIASLEDTIDRQMFRKEKWIREKIRKRWLLGKDPDGNIIGLYASEDYANEKFSQNSMAGFGNVDLTLTGSLGQKIQIGGFNNEYEIFSKDPKFDDITEKYGDYNFNITDEERKELFDEILLVILTQAIDKMYG